MLNRHKIKYIPDEPITHLAAGRNQVIIATKDKKILAIDTAAKKQTDCDLERYLGNKIQLARIHKLFIDPCGKFTLISLAYAADNQPMENLLYVKRVQPLPRLKNHLISAVAWNYPKTSTDTNNPNSTGTILLGTTKGTILQTELIHSDESKFFPLSPGPRQYVKEVFDVGSEVGAITGIEYHQIQSTNQTEKIFIILVSTNTRLYRMVGSVPASVDPPPLHLIFAQNSSNYKDVPGRINNAKLDFYYPIGNSPPTRFAWLTEPGVMTGTLHNQLGVTKASFESNEDFEIISYDIAEESYDQLSNSSTPSGMSPPIVGLSNYYNEKPLSVVVTNFHVIVLFRYCIRAICILNNTTVYKEYFPTKGANMEMKFGSYESRYAYGGSELLYGNLQGMTKDPTKNLIWVFFERAVFRYKICDEERNVWKIYLEQRNFELAKKYSKDMNYDRVITEEAQHHFNKKDYEKSAVIFAESKKSFEDVSLMFMEIKCIKALKKYLMIKLEKFELPNQSTQLTMVLAWLVEIIISSISITKTLPETDKNIEDLRGLHNELEQLLENKQVIECIQQHSNLFYGIVRNYSDLETFVRVAKLIGDFDHVLQYYIDLGEHKKALDIMRAIKKDDYFYTHGHILMKRTPKELVDAMIEQPSINPSKLIPVLIQENPYFNKCSETIRYLEYCVNTLRVDSKVIHNYLFELYARHRDEDTLIEYLESQVGEMDTSFAEQPNRENYLDLQLCLRLCTELKLLKTCVALYSSMGLYDEALHLALGFDVELAKNIARKVDTEDHQKRLWLAIAENVLTKNLDIQIATSLLRECRLLKIEDILPFFPDYTTIDFFKDAIRQSLQEYRQQIMTLKDGTYDSIADLIRGEIKAFRNRYSIIKVGQRCEICSKNLLSKTFYVFPCGHLFHSDCIIKEIMSIDPSYKGIEDKLKQLALDNANKTVPLPAAATTTTTKYQNFLINSISSQNKTTTTTTSNNLTDINKDKILKELEEMVSSECVYCGSLLPSYIDKPPPVGFNLLDTDEVY